MENVPCQPVQLQLHMTMDRQSSVEKFEYQFVHLDNPERVKRRALEIMDQLTGWCSVKKESVILDLIFKYNPEVIVEIGVWGGKSLVPMAHALKEMGRGKVYGIDPWDNKESLQWVMDESNRNFWGWADHHAVLNELVAKIELFQLRDQIALIRCTSSEAPPIYDIDILHIDGNHSEEASFLDVTKWVPLVKSGGWILFDDIHWFENGKYTTAKAVEWLNANCIKVAEFTDQADWAMWVKP